MVRGLRDGCLGQFTGHDAFTGLPPGVDGLVQRALEEAFWLLFRQLDERMCMALGNVAYTCSECRILEYRFIGDHGSYIFLPQSKADTPVLSRRGPTQTHRREPNLPERIALWRNIDI
ncbi:uncharacterized protein H6S33_010557 [Morchella sextelata]|uniref:uncharacterized protein n=1 Tax=Morchella sextelata TaxID=1174677 RepID=UPI001D056D28|nr:uncharacterized protein H6S33_010557 [Morchella sextelata]KAH0611292.1 hypothetical protein H6S33_010557 [Morchella sextelata]